MAISQWNPMLCTIQTHSLKKKIVTKIHIEQSGGRPLRRGHSPVFFIVTPGSCSCIPGPFHCSLGGNSSALSWGVQLSPEVQSRASAPLLLL
jgi:hypothetical protein